MTGDDDDPVDDERSLHRPSSSLQRRPPEGHCISVFLALKKTHRVTLPAGQVFRSALFSLFIAVQWMLPSQEFRRLLFAFGSVRRPMVSTSGGLFSGKFQRDNLQKKPG